MIKSGSDYNELSEIKITKCDKPYVHYHTRKSPKKPKLDLGNPREDKVKRPIPPYVTDENSQPDVPYEYMTKNLNKGVKGSYEVTVIKREITTAIPPNPEIKEFVGDFEIKMNEQMKKIMCKSISTIDTRFSFIRAHESPLGNYFADIMRKQLSADCALLNAGALRSDRIYEPGYLSIGDWADIFPYRKSIMKVEVSGAQLIKILEEGISKYPALDGRFPQVSYIKFEFDADKPPYSRINHDSVLINGEPIEKDRKYSIVSTHFITSGKDGYVTFEESTPLMGDDEAPVFNDLLHSVLTHAQKEIYLEEFKLYKEREEEISKNFIRNNIKDKVNYQLSVLDFVSACGIEDSEDDESEYSSVEETEPEETAPKKKKLVRVNSLVFSKQSNRDVTKTTIDCLNRHNIEIVTPGDAKLSIGCLIR